MTTLVFWSPVLFSNDPLLLNSTYLVDHWEHICLLLSLFHNICFCDIVTYGMFRCVPLKKSNISKSSIILPNVHNHQTIFPSGFQAKVMEHHMDTAAQRRLLEPPRLKCKLIRKTFSSELHFPLKTRGRLERSPHLVAQSLCLRFTRVTNLVL